MLTLLKLGQSFSRAKERARDDADVMDTSTGVGSEEEGVFDNGDSKNENGGGAGSEERLAPEAIRSKVMHVASMDALRKKIQVIFSSVAGAQRLFYRGIMTEILCLISSLLRKLK